METSVRWGNYLLDERIGIGGMAEVYRARRVGVESFTRSVCIKHIHKHLSLDTTFVRLFLDEARLGAALRHRNIISIEDLGEHEGTLFLAMEFIRGHDLGVIIERSVRARRLVPVEVLCFVMGELLAALSYAHTATTEDLVPLNVIHRDVCPRNVMVSAAGEVKLGDFGIARAKPRIASTAPGVTRGRMGFMPPEQWGGGDVDPRTDLYALGVTIFHLACGRLPFEPERAQALQLQATRPQMTDFREDLPREISRLVNAMLAPDPSVRPRNAALALEIVRAVSFTSRGASLLPRWLAELFPEDPHLQRAAHAGFSPYTLSRWLSGAVTWVRSPRASAPSRTETRHRRQRWLVASGLATIAVTTGGLLALRVPRESDRTVVAPALRAPVGIDASQSSPSRGGLPEVTSIIDAAVALPRDTVRTSSLAITDGAVFAPDAGQKDLSARASTRGWLVVVVSEWSTVSVDHGVSKTVHETQRYLLTEGSHHVAISGGVVWQGSVNVTAGQTTFVRRKGGNID